LVGWQFELQIADRVDLSGGFLYFLFFSTPTDSAIFLPCATGRIRNVRFHFAFALLADLKRWQNAKVYV